jgi:hypothetical protein
MVTCPPGAQSLLDTTLHAALAGAWDENAPENPYFSGVDTLGFGSRPEATQWYVSGVHVRCLTSTLSHAEFEVVWSVEARVSWNGIERLRPTLTDTASLTHRWVINDVEFLLRQWSAEGAREWGRFPEADLQFMDSLIRRGGRSYEQAGRDQCPEPAWQLLDRALGAEDLRDLGQLGFIRAEALGDSPALVFAQSVRCLSGSASHALFAVTQSWAGTVLYTKDGARLGRNERSHTSQVSVSHRWVVDDLAQLIEKFGNPDLLRRREFDPALEPLLDSIAPLSRSQQ